VGDRSVQDGIVVLGNNASFDDTAIDAEGDGCIVGEERWVHGIAAVVR